VYDLATKIITEHAASMTTSAHALPESCPNCSHSVSGPYCSQCGQKTLVETPTLWEFIHEYLHHYVAIDGTLTRTLKLLIARPGKLTTEYLAGRRASYIKPLQLYLTISFVFFIALSLFGSKEPDAVVKAPDAGAKAVAAPGVGNTNNRKETAVNVSAWLDNHPLLRPVFERFKERQSQFKVNNQEANRELDERVTHYAPYGIFGMMPIVAFLLWVMYRKRGLRYGAHLVFAFHLHAFVFLLLLIGMLPIDIFDAMIPFAIYAYLVIALRQTYGGRWMPQILRSFVLVVGYSIFGLIATAIVWSAAFLA
jgi:hypothetical protein